MFAALSRLYFAAASFSETERRLLSFSLTRADGRGEGAHRKRSEGFLLNENPRFGPAVRNITAVALKQPLEMRTRSSLLDKIRSIIEPFDIAGLNDRARHNWHPVLAEDLLTGRAKVGATEDEIKELLRRVGFSGTSPA
jgi:hypothetical protein